MTFYFRLILAIVAVAPLERMLLLSLNTPIDNFCYLPCGGVINVGCTCRTESGCSEYVHADKTKFRQRMLRRHNELRERVAAGYDGREYLSTAANMNILNYDVNLERSALCQALSCNAKPNPNACLRTRLHNMVHSNEYTINGTEINKNNELDIELAVARWFEEIAYITSGTIKTFNPNVAGLPKGATILNFGHLIKDDISGVGCAVAARKTGTKVNLFKVVCHYGGIMDMPNKRLYIAGVPCTKCSFDMTCSTDSFPSLCGELWELPH